MNVLYPAFLLGGLLIAIPIVLHLLRRDIAPEVPFSAVRLLRKSPIERSHRRRLRDLLLLAARVAALILLAAAFARPYLAGSGIPAKIRIVAIDRSFSMSAPGLFDRARQLARQAIDGAPRGERVALVAFDDRADVLAPPGAAADARLALDLARPGFGATRYGSAVARAVELADGAPGEVILITDLQRSGWDDEQPVVLPSALRLTVQDAGELPENLAVVHVATFGDRIVASIRNTGAGERTGQVRAAVDGRDLASAPFRAPAGSTVDVTIPGRLPSSGALAVSVDDRTGYAADNIRYAALDPQSDRRVLVVRSAAAGDSGFYASRALDAAGRDDGFGVRSVTGGELSRVADADLDATAAMVLLSTRGFDRTARDRVAAFVRHGGGLLVTAGPDVDADVVSSGFGWRTRIAVSDPRTDPVALAPTDLRHPIFRPFTGLAANLAQVRFWRGWIVGSDGWEVAARFTDGTPALLERREQRGHVLLFASDFDRRWNDFPLHPAFVPFAVEAVRYVASPTHAARDYVVGAAPAGAGPQPGVFRIQPQNRLVAVNVDPRESATARLTAEAFDRMVQRVDPAPAATTRTRAQQEEARQGLWRYGLMLMLLALVGESFVGRP